MIFKGNKTNILANSFLLFFFICTAVSVGYAQAKGIKYGDNTAAGKYFSIRGFNMYTEVYGKGPALLLIHGNGGSLGAFYKNISFFSKKYKVIAVDSRAHGKSVDDQDSLSFEQMADDFAVLLDSMHIKNAYVLGWSDGGINALLLALRHPDKVKKLASTGANLWPDSTALLPSAWKEELRYFQEQKDKQKTTAKERNDWKIFLLDWLQPNIPLTELNKIKCPSLIISGDKDVINLEHTLLIYQNIAGAQLWVLPKSGHATLIEHSDEFNRKVDDFFMATK
ncbi:MAG: alpha/beta hydrolase [Nitrospira sp.]